MISGCLGCCNLLLNDFNALIDTQLCRFLGFLRDWGSLDGDVCLKVEMLNTRYVRCIELISGSFLLLLWCQVIEI